MRQPVGLYLAEFTPAEPIATFARAGGLPRFDALDEPSEADIAVPSFGTFEDADPMSVGEDAPAAQDGADLDGASPEWVEPAADAADTAALIAALQAEHAAALAAARQQWAEQEGAALAAGLATALAELETRITDTLAPLLEPFLVQAAQLAALTQLRGSLGTLFDGPDGAITVSGPADLLDPLRRACGDRAGLAFTETDLPDVTVTMGDTRIQSQLAGWARALEASLELAP